MKDVQFSILDPISLKRGATSISGVARKYQTGGGATTKGGVRRKPNNFLNGPINDHEDTESYQVINCAFGQTIGDDIDLPGDGSPI